MGGELSLETYVHDDKMRSFESKLNLIEQSQKTINDYMNNGIDFYWTVHFYTWPLMYLFWRTP